MQARPFPARPSARLLGDLLAGVSVAFVLIPQSLAYAELAGVPAPLGLYAAALPPIVAAFFASSPFLQTGPTALTSILTFGVLSSVIAAGSPAYAGAAALLALVVGVVRVALGVFRLGGVAYFMSQPVLQGFTSAAAVLILASQVPAALGAQAGSQGIFAGLGWTLAHPGEWRLGALLFSALTLLLMLGGRWLSPRFPGVLVAAVAGVGLSLWTGYAGPVIGNVSASWPRLSLALPWAMLPSLLLGGAIIAVVGFAEPTAIARTLTERGRRWQPDREFVSQGAANLVAGLVGAFPVGGSFSRSSLNKLAGAKSRWSGLVTGLVVLAFLPFSGFLAPLPKAVLAAVVIGAVLGLLEPRALLKLWRYAKLQALTAYATFALTLLLAPRIDVAVLVGVALAVAAHLYRESRLEVSTRYDDDVLYLTLSGVLWFGSLSQLETVLQTLLRGGVAYAVVDVTGAGRIDLSSLMLLSDFTDEAKESGVEVELRGLKPHMQRVLARLREE